MSRSVTDDKYKPLDVDKIRPYGDHFLAREIKRSVTMGGIHLLEKTKRSSCWYGAVVRVGPGGFSNTTGERMPMRVSCAERVIVMEYSGRKFHLSEGKYRIVREHAVWAKIEMDSAKTGIPITKLIPFNGKILVRMDKHEKTLSGLLFLPGKLQTQFSTATVESVYDSWRHPDTGQLVTPVVKKGDRVMLNRYSGAQVEINGEEYRLAEDNELHAIIEGKEVNVDIVPSESKGIHETGEDLSHG